MARPAMSIRARLLLFLITANLVLVVAFAVCTVTYIQREMLESFDRALKANAEAVRALVDVDDEERDAGTAIPVQTMSRFRRSRRPDLFGLLYVDGKVLAKSGELEELPDFVKRVENPRVREFEFRGDTYRGIVLPPAKPREMQPEEEEEEVISFFASAREGLDEELEDAIEFVLVASIGVLIFSLVTAWLVARASLKPFARIAEQTSQIDERSLHLRFDTDTLPRDLLPFGRALNNLLQRLEGAFQREKRFSADAAHELRTPVASIKAGIQAAQLSPRDAADDTRLLHELLDDTARLEELCEALLTTATAEAARDEEVHLAATALVEQLGASVAEIMHTGQSNGHDLIAEPAPTLPADMEVRTEAIVVRRIVVNLLSNALRHGGPNLSIRLRVEPPREGFLTVVVEDNGVGIPLESRGKIFERFFRHEGSRTRKAGGAGLGLAICRKLALRDGGTITYEPREGGGCVFRWSIAVAEKLVRESEEKLAKN